MLALRMIGRRAALSVFSLFLVSLFIFVMVEALPGDAATRYLGRMATEEQKALLRTRLNLDTPAPQRYVQWLAGIARLDFGNTMVMSRPIKDVLAPKIANTLILAGAAFLLYLPLSLIPAAIQALNRDRGVDHAFSVLTLILLSTPDFLLGTLLLLLFVVTFSPAARDVGGRRRHHLDGIHTRAGPARAHPRPGDVGVRGAFSP